MSKLASLNKAPTYDLYLPFSKKKIIYRPYTVAEQKLLLIAKEEGDNKSMVNAIRQLIQNCTFDKVDINTIPTFETEYLLLNVRGRAVSDTINLVMTCTECSKETNVGVKIDDVKIVGDVVDTSTVKLSDQLYVVMTYPTASDSNLASEISADPSESQQFNTSLDLMIACMKTIVDGDDMYEVSEQSKEDMTAFINTLMEYQINQLKDFIENCPTVLYQEKHTCKHCGTENETYVGGLSNFFG